MDDCENTIHAAGDVGRGLLSGLGNEDATLDKCEEKEGREMRNCEQQVASLNQPADEYEESLIRKSQRSSQLTATYLLVFGSVFLSWFLGQMGFSVAWVVILLITISAFWLSSFNRLIEDCISFERIRLRRRRALETDETAEWVNFLVNRWWVFSSNTIFTLIKNALDPLLNESKPAFLESVELREFTLGDSTPFVNSVKAFDISSGVKRVLNGSLGKPLFDLAQSVKYQLALELCVGLHCPDYRMLLRSRFGGKGVGMDLDIAMEKLNINGKLNVILSLNMDSAFPHITKASFSFVEKPEVWFNLRVLKTVQMMEVPGLKSWLHSLVMDALTTALVDPGKLDVNICPVDGYVPSQQSSHMIAQGVLTITLSKPQQNNKVLSALNEEERWFVIHLGEQKQVTSRVSSSVRWQECRTFLVENLNSDKLNIKLKTKRLISTITLAHYEVPLITYNLESNRVVETALQKKGPKGITSSPNINIRMEYTPLTLIDSMTEEKEQFNSGEVAGVMYVCIHGADDLVAPDKRGVPNPYCIIFCNRKKVKTSHYICRSSNPKWESCVEFLVADYLEIVLSFAVCNWDTTKMADSDLLGIGSLAMIAEEPVVVRRQIPLSFNVPTNVENNFGSITISAIFRPVASVAESDDAQLLSPIWCGADDEDNPNFKFKKNNPTFMQTAKMLLTNSKDQESTNIDFADILSSGSGLMELTVIRARDLVAKDLNGFSDPYCEVKINNECVFKTSIIKKTLNPEWEESATLQLPKTGEELCVIVWDRDPLGMRDFLGSLTLTLDEIRQISAKNSSDWFMLKDTKTGEIEIKIKVISEDFESQEVEKSSPIDNDQMMTSPVSSPTVTTWTEKNESLRITTTKPILPTTSPASTRKLPLAVPSPIPPRKTSQLTSINGQATSEEVSQRTSFPTEVDELCTNQNSSSSATPSSTPRLPTRVDIPERPEKDLSPTESVSPTSAKRTKTSLRATAEYSSIRAMKQKMKIGLTHPLRRFRSEASVHEPKAKSMRERVTVETRDPSLASEFESLSQATSHPNISQLIPSPDDKKEFLPSKEAKTRFYNIQGRIIQGLGFQVSQQSLIYCRVRLHRNFEKSSRSSSGKTICKSVLIPASINPRFDTEFQIESSNGVLKSAVFVIDIRTEKKETIATKTIILKEVFEDSKAESQEVLDWFVLSNGCKLEIELSHGKPMEKKQSSNRLFRSWSVHRIGKI